MIFLTLNLNNFCIVTLKITCKYQFSRTSRIGHDCGTERNMNEEFDNLAQEIEAYPELKESLQRFLDNPEMERYTAKELKEFRYGQRK